MAAVLSGHLYDALNSTVLRSSQNAFTDDTVITYTMGTAQEGSPTMGELNHILHRLRLVLLIHALIGGSFNMR